MTQKALLQGAGDGTAVPAGYVGQIIQSSPVSNVTLAATNSWKDLCTITLTPGTWILSGTSVISTTGGTITRVGSGISITTSTPDETGKSCISVLQQSANSNHYINCGVRYLSVSSNTTIYLIGYCDYTVIGSMVWLNSSNLQAVRIA